MIKTKLPPELINVLTPISNFLPVKYKFKFLEQYYDRAFLQSWINTIPWDNTKKLFDGDIDNKIMHIGCLLQFQRDFFDDKEASKALEYLKKGNTLKIVYDDPWYWKLLLYKKEQ